MDADRIGLKFEIAAVDFANQFQRSAPQWFSLPGMVKPRSGIGFCNTGQYAAGAWFVLDRLLGLKGVGLFPGGFYEWAMLDLPVDER